ncbi:MAG: DUF503 domain-containing protein [Planctomycetota bacterium]
MIIGVLQIELAIPWAESLKDKRRVIKSLKDRLHREHQVSVAEVAAQEALTTAILGVAAVGSDGRYIGQTLDRISEKARSLHDAEVVATRRHLISGDKGAFPKPQEPVDHGYVQSMIDRARELENTEQDG